VRYTQQQVRAKALLLEADAWLSGAVGSSDPIGAMQPVLNVSNTTKHYNVYEDAALHCITPVSPCAAIAMLQCDNVLLYIIYVYYTGM
jgi:hypothetical protein